MTYHVDVSTERTLKAQSERKMDLQEMQKVPHVFHGMRPLAQIPKILSRSLEQIYFLLHAVKTLQTFVKALTGTLRGS